MVDLNPLHLIKKGADAIEHTGSSLLHGAENAGTNLLNEALGAGKSLVNTGESLASSAAGEGTSLFNSAVDLGKSVVDTVTHLDVTKLESTVGQTLTAAALCAAGPIGACAAAFEAKSLVSSVSSIANASDVELAKKYGMTKVSANAYVSKDNAFGLQKVASLVGNKDAADLGNYINAAHKQFGAAPKAASRTADSTQQNLTDGSLNGPTDGSLDLSSDIYASNDQQKEAGPVQKHEYQTGAVHNEVDVRNGEVSFKATENGRVVTEAYQNAGYAGIEHNGDNASIDRRTGSLTFENKLLHFAQNHGDGVYHIRNGLTIQRKGGELDVYDHQGKLLQQLDVHGLTIGRRVRMVTTQSNNAGSLENAAQQAKAQNGEREVNIAVAPDHSFVALFKNGAKLEATAQRDAILKAEDGTVFYIPRHGELQVWVDGHFVSLDEAREKGKVKVDSQGNAVVGDMKISRTGGINANGVQVSVDSLAGGATVRADGQTVTAAGPQVTTTTNDGATFRSNIQNTQVDTKELTVNLNEVRVHHEGKPDTIIKKDNTVEFDGGKGPVLHPDGSMKLDDQTTIDAHGNVRSGTWTASANTDSAARVAAAHSSYEAQATSTSTAATAEALNVYAKALSGKATMSDISTLNNDLASVSGLIQSLAQAGCTDLIPALTNAQSMISEAISFALPRVQSTQNKAA